MLGLGVGAREDDYEAAGVDFHKRGAIFERQLADLRDFWAGEGGVGPAPANGERPAMLIGGGADVAYRRAAEYADGWTLGGGPPEAFAEGLAKLKDAWSAAGRDGEPRTMAMIYFALGDGAEEIAQKNFGDYYAFLGDYAQNVVDSAATDEDTLKSYLAAFEEAGADEVSASRPPRTRIRWSCWRAPPGSDPAASADAPPRSAASRPRSTAESVTFQASLSSSAAALQRRLGRQHALGPLLGQLRQPRRPRSPGRRSPCTRSGARRPRCRPPRSPPRCRCRSRSPARRG